MCGEWTVGDYSGWCDLWLTCLNTIVQNGFAIAGAEVPRDHRAALETLRNELLVVVARRNCIGRKCIYPTKVWTSTI